MSSYFVKNARQSKKTHIQVGAACRHPPPPHPASAVPVGGVMGVRAAGPRGVCPRAPLETGLSSGQCCLETREVGCEMSRFHVDTSLPEARAISLTWGGQKLDCSETGSRQGVEMDS